MALKTLPGSPFEVVETKFLFHLLMRLFANPPCLDGNGQSTQIGRGRQVGEVVLLLSRGPVFADEPSLVPWQMLLTLVPDPLRHDRSPPEPSPVLFVPFDIRPEHPLALTEPACSSNSREETPQCQHDRYFASGKRQRYQGLAVGGARHRYASVTIRPLILIPAQRASRPLHPIRKDLVIRFRRQRLGEGGNHGCEGDFGKEVCCEAEHVSEAGKGWSDNRIIEALETSPSMVYRVRKQLVEEGFE